jgi:hypothetical protein
VNVQRNGASRKRYQCRVGREESWNLFGTTN